MWCLRLFLPLLIVNLVPEGDDFWDNFLMLLTIMDYVFALITSDDKADYVVMLVEDFFNRFQGALHWGTADSNNALYDASSNTWMNSTSVTALYIINFV